MNSSLPYRGFSNRIETFVKNREVVQTVAAERSLAEYTRQMFNIVDPAPYLHNWHIDAICEHLEALYKRQIRNLLVTIQFRSMKSTILNVMFPSWVWLQDPSEQFMHASYNHKLSQRDNQKCRNIIMSMKYQGRWGDRFELMPDVNTLFKFGNDKGGYKIATHVSGSTGEGANILVVDDPHNILKAESQADRQSVIRWFREVWSSRLNNPSRDCQIVAQQCTHPEDLAAYIKNGIKDGASWEHLNLPSRYDKRRHCSTSIGWEDPRTEEGELLWPERFDEAATAKLESVLGLYAASAQMQQQPIPRKGKMFDAESFIVDAGLPEIGSIDEAVRYWDKAGTEGGGKRTAGVLMFRLKNGKFFIAECKAGQWDPPRRERIISNKMASDTALCRKLTGDKDFNPVTWVEQEPGSGGKESADNTILKNPGFVVKAERVTGSKESRAEPYSVQVEAGSVHILQGGWNKDFLEEHALFPASAFKDRVDAAAGAFNKISRPISEAGIW